MTTLRLIVWLAIVPGSVYLGWCILYGLVNLLKGKR
jgi:hypothetical protein